MVLCDAHFHLMQYLGLSQKGVDSLQPAIKKIKGCSCALDVDEFESMEKICKENLDILPSFGIHPQNPDEKLLPYLENLLKNKRIAAVGEIGFDFFTPEFRENRFTQEKIWNSCLNLAIKYGFPIIIHNRKALDMMFAYSKTLSCVHGVMFHSFPFGFREAENLLDRGLDAYFSFGKNLLRGSKKNVECIKNLPSERILLETDAPYMTLKDENLTQPSDIESVYESAAKVKDMEIDVFSAQIEKNFMAFFKKSPYSFGRDSSSAFIASTAPL